MRVQKKKLCDICFPKQWKTISSDSLQDSGYPVYGANGIIGFYSEYNHEKKTLLITCRGATCGSLNICEPYSYVNGNAMALDNLSEEIDIQYLFYYLQYRGFSDVITGSAQPQIVRNSLEKIYVFYPEITQQKKICDTLDKVCELIALRRKQLERLDLMGKARFVEMFGFLGELQRKWNLIRLSECCEINPKKNKDARLFSDLEISFIPMSAVSETGEIVLTEVKIYDDVKNGFTYFAENDVLFAKITPCMENGKGAIAKGLCNGIGFGSTEFHVLRPIAGKSDSQWLYTMTTFEQFRRDAMQSMTGSAGQKRVPASFLESYKIALPPIEWQQQFSAFVTEIDKLKLPIRRSLDTLEVLKKSLMQEYFGQGV